MVVRIPLSKRSKTIAGQFEAIVSLEDDDLALHNWQVSNEQSGTRYVRGHFYGGNSPSVAIHRIIMERMIHPLKLEQGQIVDHINHDALDNRRENLRVATKQQNMFNMKQRPKSTSPYKGIYWNKSHKKWRAQICIDRKKIYLGGYSTPEEAYEVYCAKAKELFGEFASFE